MENVLFMCPDRTIDSENALFETQASEAVLTLSSFLPLKCNLLIGPYNRVSRRTQWLLGKELEAVKLFPFENLKILKVKVFRLVT